MLGVVKGRALHDFVEKTFDLCQSRGDSLLIVLVKLPINIQKRQKETRVINCQNSSKPVNIFALSAHSFVCEVRRDG